MMVKPNFVSIVGEILGAFIVGYDFLSAMFFFLEQGVTAKAYSTLLIPIITILFEDAFISL